MTDRDQLVQLRSLPSNRLARRHPGELMIPIRKREGNGPPPVGLFGVLGLTTGWIGRLSSGVGINMIPDVSTPCTLTVRGGFNETTAGRTNMGLMGTNVADQNVRVLGLTDQVGVGVTLYDFTGVDWSDFELVLVGQDLGAAFQVDSLTVNGIPTDTALPSNAGAAARFAFANITRICDVANEVDDQIGHRWDSVRFQTTDGFDYDFRLEEGAGAFFNSSGDFWENPNLAQPADFNLTEDVDWTWVLSADPLPLPPPSYILGLVTQADVNTRGRTDDAPFDHVVGAVGVATGAPGVGAPGIDGFEPSTFDGLADYYTLADVDAFNTWVEPPHSIAVRIRLPATQIEPHGVPYCVGGNIGFQTRTNFEVANSGLASFRATNTPGTVTASAPGTTNIEDGQEHVIVGTTDGVTVQFYIDGGLEFDDTIFNNPLTPMDELNEHLWGLRIRGTIIERFFLGEIFWSGGWDRVLTQAEVTQLGGEANPFVNLVPDPGP